MNISQDQYNTWCAAFGIDDKDESQRPGVEGSITDLAEGRGTLPEFMVEGDLWGALLSSRAAALQAAADNAPVVEEAPVAPEAPVAVEEAAVEAPVEEVAAPEVAVEAAPVAEVPEFVPAEK